jgi:hypothetical protein
MHKYNGSSAIVAHQKGLVVKKYMLFPPILSLQVACVYCIVRPFVVLVSTRIMDSESYFHSLMLLSISRLFLKVECMNVFGFSLCNRSCTFLTLF